MIHDTTRRRFLREAEACAALKHPNIVPVHDIGQHEGRYYFSMEFVEGQTLLDWTRKTPRSTEEVLKIMQRVCEAIAYAHPFSTWDEYLDDPEPYRRIVRVDGGVLISTLTVNR